MAHPSEADFKRWLKDQDFPDAHIPADKIPEQYRFYFLKWKLDVILELLWRKFGG